MTPSLLVIGALILGFFCWLVMMAMESDEPDWPDDPPRWQFGD